MQEVQLKILKNYSSTKIIRCTCSKDEINDVLRRQQEGEQLLDDKSRYNNWIFRWTTIDNWTKSKVRLSMEINQVEQFRRLIPLRQAKSLRRVELLRRVEPLKWAKPLRRAKPLSRTIELSQNIEPSRTVEASQTVKATQTQTIQAG